MEFKGNKGEWSELYTTLKLLADGKIYAADENMEKLEKLVFPILQILRVEKDRSLNYLINGSIKIQDGKTSEIICEIDRSEFLNASALLFENISKLSGRSISVNRFTKKRDLLTFL